MNVINNTIRYKLVKYVVLQIPNNWIEFLQPGLDAYNNTPHSTTEIAPSAQESPGVLE